MQVKKELLCILCVIFSTNTQALCYTDDITAILDRIENRAMKVNNFQMLVTKKSIKYSNEREMEVIDQVTAHHHIISQHGRYREDYEINSSREKGLHIRHSSSIYENKDLNQWIQQDMGSSDESLTSLVSRRGEKADFSNQWALDAYIGLWGSSGFRDHPRAMWADNTMHGYCKTETVYNQNIRVTFQPNPKSDEQVMFLNPSKGWLVYRLERYSPEGKLLEESQITDYKQLGGLWIPQKVQCKKYRYAGNRRYLLLEREVDLEVLTFTPDLPEEQFRLTSNIRCFYDKTTGVKMRGYELRQACLDPEIAFEAFEDTLNTSRTIQDELNIQLTTKKDQCLEKKHHSDSLVIADTKEKFVNIISIKKRNGTSKTGKNQRILNYVSITISLIVILFLAKLIRKYTVNRKIINKEIKS